LVLQHFIPRSPKAPYRVNCMAGDVPVSLVFFNAKGSWLQGQLPIREERLISGKLARFNNNWQITHPDYMVPLEEAESIPAVEPIYPLTQGLTSRVWNKALNAALEGMPELPEWADTSLQAQQKWPGWRASVCALHFRTPEQDTPRPEALRRLAYDELLAQQLSLMIVRERGRRRGGNALVGDGSLSQSARANLPFTLTDSQESAIDAVRSDMGRSQRMMRLIMGDVGSGKTMVALFSALIAVEAGAQVAIMAPTEILARQLHANLFEALSKVGVRIDILTGRDKAAARKPVLAGCAEGAIKILIGTHALFQEGVAFRNLGLVIIDEQHRFGVHQRLALGQKGEAPHMLLMSATPIPRSMVLALYGDLDISKLLTKPAGRQPIKTLVKPQDQWGEVAQALGRAIERGDQVYWICPLVEETEVSTLTAAEERHAMLKEMFGPRVALVHGRMKGEEKDTVMRRFKAHEADILVATTVVEVGVDVPNATVMVIEHAERFGLAQLHQLRGRIGRGSKASTCLLLYTAPLGETARSRLSIMRESNDGFVIAEEDLRLRGAGDVMGTRQSGLPDMHFAALPEHQDLLEIAQRDAQLTLNKAPELSGARGEALRTLLYLFEREQAIAFLEAG
ncbi:MAG: ATP-dependent DNA helicase RecG, partial [Alphaproteobacteria bacterium]